MHMPAQPAPKGKLMPDQAIDYCLDLREFISLDELSRNEIPSLEAWLDTPLLAKSTRIYIGSSFCPQALFHSASLIEAVVGLCNARGLKATFSLPIATQYNLKQLSSKAKSLIALGQGVIDEVVANDLGTLEWLCALSKSTRIQTQESTAGESLPRFSVGLGRLLSKDTRDPRDAEYSWTPYQPAALQQDWEGTTHLDKLLVTFSYWDEQEEAYWSPVSSIELDPTHATIELYGLPAYLTPVLNGPTCYMSTGQICEYASVGLGDESLFRPNAPCAHQCTEHAIRYRGSSGVEFAKLGRTVYFLPDWECAVTGVGSYRQLISPLWEMRR